MLTTVDTRDVDPRDRFDYWHAAQRELGFGLDFRSPSRDFVASLRRRTLGPIAVSRVSFQSPHATSKRRPIDNYCFAEIQLGPSGGEFIGEYGYTLRPMALHVHDGRERYRKSFADASSAVYAMIPRDLIRSRVYHFETHLRGPVSYHSGLVALLAEQFGRLVETEDMSPVVQDDMAESLLDLLAATMRDAERRSADWSDPARYATLQRVKAYINRNFRDASLSPPEVAEQFGLSVSSLHRLFRLEGTSISRFVQARRLDAAAAELADGNRSINQIAFSVGFTNPNSFTRSFKQRFGYTPRAHKRS